jgi:hypothetical protein
MTLYKHLSGLNLYEKFYDTLNIFLICRQSCLKGNPTVRQQITKCIELIICQQLCQLLSLKSKKYWKCFDKKNPSYSVRWQRAFRMIAGISNFYTGCLTSCLWVVKGIPGSFRLLMWKGSCTQSHDKRHSYVILSSCLKYFIRLTCPNPQGTYVRGRM